MGGAEERMGPPSMNDSLFLARGERERESIYLSDSREGERERVSAPEHVDQDRGGGGGGGRPRPAAFGHGARAVKKLVPFGVGLG